MRLNRREGKRLLAALRALGDVKDTFADIEASPRDLGFVPRTSIDDGIPRFVEWFRNYERV
jgi:UDP-glucuronate 4-epimerase